MHLPTPPATALATPLTFRSPARMRALALAATALALAGAAPAAMAAGNDAAGAYVQGGHNIANGTDTDNLFLGVTLPRYVQSPGSGTSSYWDLYIGQWRGPQANGVDRSYTQIGALAMWRWRFSEGQSKWFAEAGIGLSYLDDTYSKPGGRTFGSRLNFTERLGLGRSFGPRDAHELSVSYQHHSNAGIKKPNPGEDFIQVRYAYKF